MPFEPRSTVMPRRSRIVAASIVALLAAVPGCNDPAPTTRAAPEATCSIDPDSTPARSLLACTEKSVVQVITNNATGTGVIIAVDDTTYVVTNEHVVDPFAAADVSIRGVTATDLPVIGIDAASDIAVLGPIDDDRFGPPLRIAVNDDLERGDDVFLIGFPGEVDDADELESTISRGIVSRRRRVTDWDQTYIQTDASIAGGQSGGPLFDSDGRLVGISGLSFADRFALVLGGDNVTRAVTRILDDGGDEYLSLPLSNDTDAGTGDPGLMSGTLQFADAGVRHQLWLPQATEERTLEFTVATGPRPIVTIEAQGEDEPLAETLEADEINQELDDLVQRANDEADGGADAGASNDDTALGADETADDRLDGQRDEPPWADAQVEPGSFRVAVPAETGVTIIVTLPLAFPDTGVAWTSNQPLFPMTRPLPITDVEIGSTTDTVINGFEVGAEFHVGLVENRRYRVLASSPQADVGFTLFNPEVEIGPTVWADLDIDGVERVEDSDAGLYGLDAELEFRAASTGTFRVRVHHNDGTTIAARFSIVDVTDEPSDSEEGP